MPVPSDPTLQIWYDGADSTQFQPSNPSSGSAITQWTDKSATAHNAAPTGGPSTRPLFATNVQNGKSAVYFDQIEDGLEAPISQLASLTASSVIWAGKTFNTSSNQQVLQAVNKSGGSYTSTNGLQLYISGSSNFVVGFASASAVSNVPVDTGWHIHTLLFDGTQIGNTNRLKYRVDGVERQLTYVGNVSSSTGATDNAMLFGTDASLNNDFLGYMGEVLVYTKTLTGSQLTNTESYLFNKWNTIPASPSPSPTPSFSVTPSVSPAAGAPTGSEVVYTTGTYFDAYVSQSGITNTNGISTNNGAWQLFYAHQQVIIPTGSNSIGLNTYQNGSNSWTWYAAVASNNNSTASWGAVQTLTSLQSFSYSAGGFNQSNLNQTNITIPAGRYFLLANSGGPFYRTVKPSTNRTATVSGSAFVTSINRVALGNWPSGGTTTIPTQFGGSGTGYTEYTGSVHVMSAKFR